VIGLDTNVLVRYLTQDDPVQASKAVRVLDALSQANPGYISLVVVVELVWVLKLSYAFTKGELITVVDDLLHSKELIMERADLVSSALRLFKNSRAGFSDCIIVRCHESDECEYTLTFDRTAAELAGMRLLA
jgi:predicted nucleic-acid-binding protein